RPDYIIVGEIRGSEAYVMFQAMATGHGGLCTMHADSYDSAAKRLQQKPMDIPPAYLPLMNCAIVIRRIKDSATGQSARRAITLEEIKSATQSNTVFRWDPRTDYFESNIQQSVLLQRIAEQTGQTFEDVLNEYEKRIKILRYMQETDIRDFKEVGRIIGRYYREPKILMEKIERSS
ncbi:MAG TPA: ATPase, T2SS/T4P/T4SS family, partial [Nitrosopumilaceae archaeon]|nr:ATPase, T2SS/T4P/T4SS family [Nitrosopumilaceae archaeon]